MISVKACTEYYAGNALMFDMAVKMVDERRRSWSDLPVYSKDRMDSRGQHVCKT